MSCQGPAGTVCLVCNFLFFSIFSKTCGIDKRRNPWTWDNVLAVVMMQSLQDGIVPSSMTFHDVVGFSLCIFAVFLEGL